ncbi:hypothetical protein FLA_4586 [Filimonas lacunae]|nr:hypothetical protein FLA_4586 [Filimonas lacunae]
MKVHMGEIIRKLVEEKNIPRNKIASCINTVESYLYKIYNKEEVRIGHLINMSPLLNFNLLEPYFELEELKGIEGSQWNTMKRQLEEYQKALTKSENENKKSDMIMDYNKRLVKENEELKERNTRYEIIINELQSKENSAMGEESGKAITDEKNYTMRRGKRSKK